MLSFIIFCKRGGRAQARDAFYSRIPNHEQQSRDDSLAYTTLFEGLVGATRMKRSGCTSVPAGELRLVESGWTPESYVSKPEDGQAVQQILYLRWKSHEQRRHFTADPGEWDFRFNVAMKELIVRGEVVGNVEHWSVTMRAWPPRAPVIPTYRIGCWEAIEDWVKAFCM